MTHISVNLSPGHQLDMFLTLRNTEPPQKLVCISIFLTLFNLKFVSKTFFRHKASAVKEELMDLDDMAQLV